MIVVLLLLPLLIFICLVASAFCGLGGLMLDKVVKLSDLPTLLAATLVAIVLQYFLQKRVKTKDAEKETLSTQISEILAGLVTLRVRIAQLLNRHLTPEEASSLTSAFDEQSAELSSLEFCLSESHCKELVSTCTEIGNHYLRYKRMITGGDFPVSPIRPEDFARTATVRDQITRGLRLLSFNIGNQP